MKKSSKRFILTSERQNDNGFRVRTAGIDLSDFKNNPVLLWMHRRPLLGEKNEVLPLGYWEDIEVQEEKITAIPVFDEEDEFAMKIFRKVENGTIRMASAGLAKPHVFRVDDGEDMVWLEKSRMIEASLVDIGANSEALAHVALYNENDEIIPLSLTDIKTQFKTSEMKMIQLKAPEVLAKLNLPEDATAEQAQEAIDKLVTLAASQKTQITTLTTEKKEAEDKAGELQKKLDEQVKLASEAEINSMLDKAVQERKITADEKEDYAKLAASNKEAVKGLLDKKKAVPTVKQALAETATTTEDYTKLSWDDMDRQGKLELCKKEDPDAFKQKFKEKFKTEYKGD